MQVGKTFTRKNTKASTWVQQTPTRMWKHRGETSQSQCPHYRVTGWIYSCTTRPQHTSGQCPIKNSTAADSATLYLLGAKQASILWEPMCRKVLPGFCESNKRGIVARGGKIGIMCEKKEFSGCIQAIGPQTENFSSAQFQQGFKTSVLEKSF